MSDLARKRKRREARQEFFDKQMAELERKNRELAERRKSSVCGEGSAQASCQPQEDGVTPGIPHQRPSPPIERESPRVSASASSPERPPTLSTEAAAPSRHVAWTSSTGTTKNDTWPGGTDDRSEDPNAATSSSGCLDDEYAAAGTKGPAREVAPSPMTNYARNIGTREARSMVGSSAHQNSSKEEDPDDPFGGFTFRRRTSSVSAKPSLLTATAPSASTIQADSASDAPPTIALSKGGGIRTTKRGNALEFSDDDCDAGRVNPATRAKESDPLFSSSTPVSQDNSVGRGLTSDTAKNATFDAHRADGGDGKGATTSPTQAGKDSSGEGTEDEFVFRGRRNQPPPRSDPGGGAVGPTSPRDDGGTSDSGGPSDDDERDRPSCKRTPGRNPIALEREANRMFLATMTSSSPPKPQGGSTSKSWDDDDDGFLSDCEPVPAVKETKTRTKGSHDRKRTNSVDSCRAEAKKPSSKKMDKRQRNDSAHEEDDRRGGINCSFFEDDSGGDADEGDCNPEALKPVLDDPQFGPDIPMQPLVLIDGEGNKQAVPASLNRYLAPFQKEGVKFMYNCLARRSGVILGDEMGCGKTVQVIALLCALFDKTGTGKDLQDIKKRTRLVRDRISALQKLRDEAFRRGEVVEGDNGEWSKSLGLSPWHPVMIVVPPTIVESWKKSFDMFTHFSVEVYSSSRQSASVNAVFHGGCDVLLVPKSLFASEDHFKELNKLDWKLVIIDEFHNYKGMKTKLSKHLRLLKEDHQPLVVGMTGTLMQNNHKELWNLCDLVETNFLGTWEDFNRDVDRAISLGRQKGADKQAIHRSENASHGLRESLSKIMIERKKEDVLGDQLPEKNEQVIFCELSPLQKEVYRHVLQLPDFELVRKGSAPCDCGINMHIFKQFLRLSSKAEQVEFSRTNKNRIVKQSKCCKQIPLNPRRHEPGEPEIDPDAAIWRTLDAHSAGEGAILGGCEQCPWCCIFPCLKKLVKLSSHLALIQAQKTSDAEARGSPAHVRYTKEREFAKVALVGVVEKLPGRDFDRNDSIMDDHYSLSGKLRVLDKLLTNYYREGGRVLLFAHSTQLLDLIEHWLKSRGTIEYRRMDGQTATSKRQGLADEYNRDSSIFLFLLSTKATGLGLTLTGANRVIIFDVDWNPSWEEQAQDRAHRIGQKRDVNVVRLISRGTVEELTYLRQIYKTHLKQDTLQESSNSHAAAPRVFRGVQGDKSRKGELFGTENLFRFKDGSFLDDIWAQLDGVDKGNIKSGDLTIHQSANLSKALLRMGDDFGYERKMEENEDVNILRETSERVIGKNQDTSIETDTVKDENTAIFSGSFDFDDREERKEEPLESRVQAVNHGDLFRSDRGGAAIPSEAEGYDEEMGGGTQNMYAILTNTNVVDFDAEGDETTSFGTYDYDADKEGENKNPSSIVPDMSKSSSIGGRQMSGAHKEDKNKNSSSIVPDVSKSSSVGGHEMSGADKEDANVNPSSIVPDVCKTSSVSGRQMSGADKEGENENPSSIVPDASKSSSVGGHQLSGAASIATFVEFSSTVKPKPCYAGKDIEEFTATFGQSSAVDEEGPQASQPKAPPAEKKFPAYEVCASPDQLNLKAKPSSPVSARYQVKNKIQLVGIINVETAKTQFSTADLLLPTYKKKKKKMKRKNLSNV